MNTISKALLASFAAACSLSAFASEASKLQAWEQAKMNQFCAAARRHNGPGMRAVLSQVFAPEAKITSMGQTLGIDDWAKQIISETLRMKDIRVYELHASRIKVKGDTATGMTVFHSVCMIPSPKNPHKNSRLEMRGTSDTRYVRRNGHWWVISDRDKSSSMTLDGKPFKG